jgi:hypothetical protein
MKVKDLIEELKKMPQEHEVYLQKDPEGNGYDELRYADPDCIYIDGDVYSTEWTFDEACFDSHEKWEEFKNKNNKCCVLAP